MNKLAELSAATVIGLSLNFIGTGEALAYSFTPITVSESSNPWFRNSVTSPSLNDNGTIAFWVYFQDSSEGLYTANNGSRNLLADTASSPVKFFIGGAGTPAINNQGTVAVYADLDNGGGGILSFNGQSLTTIADGNGSFLSFPPSVAINDSGTVAFGAELDTGNRGIFTSNGGTIKQVAELPSRNPSSFYDPFAPRVAINSSGTIGFTYWQNVDFELGYSALYLNDSVVADNSGKFELFGSPALNDQGKLTFFATLDSGNGGIFLYDGEQIIDFANNNDNSYFKGFNFYDAAINNQDTVAFFAQQNLNDGTSYQGIFTGSNPQTDKVIGVGDELLGSKVKNLSFSSKGLNNLNQIAFYAELENGSKGFFLANPTPKSVPEPVSVFSLLAMGAYGLTLKRSQHKKA
ncbi:choice-of-anchor tandem repeat NxxGxxAF-containing protein [Floridanema aerugineum]|uniref:Choice-of-anchor tandem repeat NxxGxxAF-containing protein n=1 Tax=Floridaenema aerugineum BLCC-F46 TaxID=3153654 RepID=A0ABV4X2I1_9CYAN